MNKLAGPYQFKEDGLYRLAYNMSEPSLRGKCVLFRKYVKQPGDITRAVVNLVNSDGSSGDEWLIAPLCIIKL